jgi:hypothetical protein
MCRERTATSVCLTLTWANLSITANHTTRHGSLVGRVGGMNEQTLDRELDRFGCEVTGSKKVRVARLKRSIKERKSLSPSLADSKVERDALASFRFDFLPRACRCVEGYFAGTSSASIGPYLALNSSSAPRVCVRACVCVIGTGLGERVRKHVDVDTSA